MADGSQTSWLLTALVSAAAVGYAVCYRRAAQGVRPPRPGWHAAAFYSGLAVLGAGLLGPLDGLSHRAFSAHMVQHFLLTMISAPLIALGRPVQALLDGLRPAARKVLLRSLLGSAASRQVLTLLVHPIGVTALFNVSLLVWHHPSLYQAAVRDRLVHEIEHACFFGTALLFWWTLVDPVPSHHRLSTSASLLALFATWMVGDLLGVTLTLGRDVYYPVYAEAPNPFGLTALEDQQVGGLIMWAGGGLLLAAVMLALLIGPYVRPRRTAMSGGPTVDRR